LAQFIVAAAIAADLDPRVASMAWPKRASSCPPRFATTVDWQRLTQHGDRKRRPTTLGVSSCDSPTSYPALGRIHFELRSMRHAVAPSLDVQLFEGKCYVMVWMNPIIPHTAMLKPAEWHCTVVRARWSATVFHEGSTKALAKRLKLIYTTIGPPTELQLTAPPWKKSWTFGLDDSWTRFLQSLRASADTMMYQIDANVRILEHRELHLSWH
jgi:hypothetical protein